MKSDRRARPAPANIDVAVLLAALRSESSDDRKTAAASLTGSIDRPDVLAAVTAALSDTAPKVRKSAAMSLAREGHVAAVEPIARALAVEEFDWVRASMILSLGRIGGAEAAEALARWDPASEQEREALAKARDRVGDKEVAVRWRAGAPVEDGVHGAVP